MTFDTIEKMIAQHVDREFHAILPEGEKEYNARLRSLGVKAALETVRACEGEKEAERIKTFFKMAEHIEYLASLRHVMLRRLRKQLESLGYEVEEPKKDYGYYGYPVEEEVKR